MSAKNTDVAAPTSPAPLGTPIDPLSMYNAEECMKLFGWKCRATLTNYMDKGFPLKSVDTGRAMGKDIIAWMDAQPAKKQRRGAAVTKPVQPKTRRKLAASK